MQILQLLWSFLAIYTYHLSWAVYEPSGMPKHSTALESFCCDYVQGCPRFLSSSGSLTNILSNTWLSVLGAANQRRVFEWRHDRVGESWRHSNTRLWLAAPRTGNPVLLSWVISGRIRMRGHTHMAKLVIQVNTVWWLTKWIWWLFHNTYLVIAWDGHSSHSNCFSSTAFTRVF